MDCVENAAPSSALPLGSSRILSPTRLTRVNPSGPAHVVRLLNTVLAIVAIVPEDRIKKETEVKKEEAKREGEEGEVKKEEGEEEEDEDDVPYREEIGWREVLGFIVMCVPLSDAKSHQAEILILWLACSTGIDPQRKKYTVLSPSPGKLPSTVAIAGSIEWVDSE